ncbi:MAG TPA: hypothetical protein VIK74_11895 [Parasegetibacter sp.]
MPNRTTDSLFQLIKSLEKSEKRNFKLYARRNSSAGDLKTVQLFDALDKMDEYDEALLLRKNPSIKKVQLSNLKAHLYKQILSSLRLLNDQDNLDIQLHEQLDYARIVYNKGLYLQSLRILSRIKEIAAQHNQVTFWLQALIFEKKIEALHITRSMENRAELLSREVEELDSRISMIGKLSNLSLRLYSWYIQMGHARSEKDVLAVRSFFNAQLPADATEYRGFYERLYLSQSYCWYGFILQDFLMYYRHCQKWVDLFEQEPLMKKVEKQWYIKGLHNLLNAHFMLRSYVRFDQVLEQFEDFCQSKIANSTDNSRIQCFIYINLARINRHFMQGTFTDGLKLVPGIEAGLKEHRLKLDRHRALVFYYKIACLYFGSGDNEKAIEYLNKIINWKMDLRTDLQCYSRLLHLIAHYELGNYELLEYLVKSVYRFMAKMENLSVVEEEIFRFLRKSFHLNKQQIHTAFVGLKEKLEKYSSNPLESRSYMYLDITSWLESKIRNVPVQDVIRERFLQGRKPA